MVGKVEVKYAMLMPNVEKGKMLPPATTNYAIISI